MFMATVMSEKHGKVRIPGWVVDLSSFRRWVHSDEPPEKLRAHFLNDEVWVDLFMEEAFTHNLVKNAIYATLIPFTQDIGLFFSDGMLLTNDEAGIATEPNATFISNESLAAGRVELKAGAHADSMATEVVGSPDLVIEVVSRSTEEKDTEWLMAAYHDAEIPEYWVIDARDEDDIRFDIYKRGKKEYTPCRKQDEWVKSSVLGKSFRLKRKEAKTGYPLFKLEIR
jgi:Uma2 family endonuclease